MAKAHVVSRDLSMELDRGLRRIRAVAWLLHNQDNGIQLDEDAIEEAGRMIVLEAESLKALLENAGVPNG